jgi:hypothetical protein
MDDGLDWMPDESWLLPFESKAAWERYRDRRRVGHEALWQFGQFVERLAFGREQVPGHCSPCQASVAFSTLPDAQGRIDFREQFICGGCSLSARARAVYRALQVLVPDREAAVFTTEQVSHGFRWLVSHYPKTVGSEFFTGAQAEVLQRTLDTLLPAAAVAHRTLR